MDSLTVSVLALRTRDRIKVGLERYEQIISIDHREPCVVKVELASGLVCRYGYSDKATVRSDLIVRSQASSRYRRLNRSSSSQISNPRRGLR